MKRACLAALAAAALGGCASPTRAPVVDRAPPVETARPAAPPVQVPAVKPDTYTVRRGDTLYSIALDNGLDYRELASWNLITDPNVIREGQVLSLKASPSDVQVRPIATPGSVQARPLTSAEAAARPAAPQDLVTEPKAVKLPYSEANLAMIARPVPPAARPPAPAPVQPAARPEPAPKPEERARREPADEAISKPQWEFPRLCRGGSKSLTYPGVHR